MLKKFNDFLAGLPMTIVAGVFLLLDLVPQLAEEFGGTPVQISFLPFDPAWVTIVISGIPLLYLAIWRIIHNPGISKISSALLICIAMFAAIAIGDLFAAGEVVFIMAIGALLEEATTNRAKKGLKKLISLAPTKGRRLKDGKEEMIPAEEIRQGDILRILPGETIPVDGTIISGETSVDQSIMTGESLPVDKGVGEEVFCGTINRFGSIDISATKVGENSSLQKLIRMVQDAENKQAPMQRIADRVASWLVPVALLIAILAYVFSGNIVTAVTVLVVFCPCALVLATPTAIMAAIGQATKHGVIIKSGEALEKMGKVDTIAFDKTGTLTYGRLDVSDMISFDESISETDLLSLAASAEAKSEHPLGKAIVAYAKAKEVPLAESTAFRMTTGKGIFAEVDNRRLRCGNEKFLTEKGVWIDNKVQSALERLRTQGKASVLVAENQKCIGVIALSDVLRPEAKDMVSRLSDMHTRTVLLTGDHQKTADYFAQQVGISEVRAELLPQEKVQSIEKLQAENHKVCMIGDGVNDAPALKTADVSVAMGSMGSDIAVDAAEVALMSDDISKIPYLKRLSNATVKTIKASITLSMCINFAAIVLSLMEVLTPTTGALVHNAGSCFVVLIAALLYDRKFE
ncbi:cation-translocating P-type ATPase [Mediterraneibacter glycyrrhizinilyticus]|uniref:heavy metal translocating P-type ATPase n=1 Tax=Mediterraneibacter glycyrrhizinilyticus TaxID=342942 RepID=UPI001961806E|nr:cation-translocating P-type ATPase [Mediterraneibacter glycyrrhizinilyticus]MBM6802902.1 cation-translocating P-type ATPase [Mediterraneibacter glycyrrhizinilyticus]MDM8124354.1 cation-translocating P-type ATPase [Mediterraneibacter glycyrrhizinilyticus]MDM8209433.1 cation-translocating P-type ATPase [Mediterraneibacter glycyrrhizinilyticus]